MSSLSDAINSLKIENRFDTIMDKIGVRERITVPEALQKTSRKTGDVSEDTAIKPSLKRS